MKAIQIILPAAKDYAFKSNTRYWTRKNTNISHILKIKLLIEMLHKFFYITYICTSNGV